MKRIGILVIFGLLIWAGLYMRFLDLGQKVMHTDEAVNGVMVYQTLAGEKVAFDPGHYHGPLLRYLAIPAAWIEQRFSPGGFSEVSLRWLASLAGGLSVLSLVLFRHYSGKDASFIALVFAAVSPPLVYYSRYFIHESVFVLFSLLFLYVLWKFLEERSWRLAIWAGVLLGVLHAVRETVVLVLIAGVLAVVASRGRDWREQIRWLFSREGWGRLGLVSACAIAVSVFFYSEFLTYWQGPLDSVLTYFRYETESGHEKPWYYYLHLLLGEQSRIGYLGQIWLLVFGVAGLWLAFLVKGYDEKRIRFFRFVGAYTLATTLLYSAISYKTPWLMLNFLVGWILLTGIGWVYLWERFRHLVFRGLLVVILLSCLVHSLRQSWYLGFRFSADPRNPYVYSHTSPDVLNLVHRLDVLSRLHPEGREMRIDVAGTEYWPLPWYLRDYPRVGYWQELPGNSAAPVQIFSFSGDQEIPEVDQEIYVTELRGLREGVFLFIRIEKMLWEQQFGDG